MCLKAFFSLYFFSQPELTVENLPSFLSLGKALLLLFVDEEEDDTGRRQNQVLVDEMKAVVELGQRKIEKYLPSWIHLYVHRSQMTFNQYHTRFTLGPSIMYTQTTVLFLFYYINQSSAFQWSHSSCYVCPWVVLWLYSPPPYSGPRPSAFWS